tara:strand:- start:12858 stop:13301 length:444 start_codon:yes stop_codon:yes gene_type:complete
MNGERRGLVVTFALLLVAAMFANNLGSGIQATGMSLYVRDPGSIVDGTYVRGGLRALVEADNPFSHPLPKTDYIEPGEHILEYNPDPFLTNLGCDCPPGAVPDLGGRACVGNRLGDECSCTLLVKMSQIHYPGSGPLDRVGICELVV